MAKYRPRTGAIGKHSAAFCCAIIAAAGKSERMGGRDKLFIDIAGAPVIAHTLLAFQNSAAIDEIILVVSGENLERAAALCADFKIDKASKVITGGETRLESVLNGTMAASKKAMLLAIHDGARPCVSSSVIAQAVMAARKKHSAAPAIPVSSTVKRVRDGMAIETIDRDGLFEVQTPQVFTADLIKAALTYAFKKSINVTDDCMAAELIGAPVYITEGSPLNIKITTLEDIITAEAIMKSEA
ncbi:MAG: 2-C-methyl-D-erythritol 4-phosphate cytidylyltransferase [Oscillospiraceae bacterium]|nr:2-C-methyl-D-erythritol 4-phosphate cytidylyltransferase [Oscillospiraceae bacterium]